MTHTLHTHIYDDDDDDDDDNDDEKVSQNPQAIPLPLSPLNSAHIRRIKSSYLGCNVAKGKWLTKKIYKGYANMKKS